MHHDSFPIYGYVSETWCDLKEKGEGTGVFALVGIRVRAFLSVTLLHDSVTTTRRERNLGEGERKGKRRGAELVRQSPFLLILRF